MVVQVEFVLQSIFMVVIAMNTMIRLFKGRHLANSSIRFTLLQIILLCGRCSADDVDLNFLTASTGFIMNGGAGDYFGISVKKAGDINRDGIMDIVIGTEFTDLPIGIDAGIVYVIYGRNIPGGATPFANMQMPAAPLATDVGFRILGAVANQKAGTCVSAAGDVNGDGTDDIIIGAPGLNDVYVIYGRNIPGGDPPFGDIQLVTSGTPANIGFHVLGGSGTIPIGNAVSGAGDVNGDGVADIIIGSREASKAYVIFGRDLDAGGSAFGAIQLPSTAFSASVGVRLIGGDHTGSYVSRAGDINNDNIADIMIGDPGFDLTGVPDVGGVYVMFGRVGLTGDIALGDMTPTFGFRIVGIAVDDKLGSCAAAGDVNNDGVDDIIIGAHLSDNGANADVGKAYVVFGRDIPGGAPAFANIQVTTAAVDFGFRILGASAADYLGLSVSTAGDVNGDGIDDVIVGAFAADPGGVNSAGISYVIYGRDVAGGAAPFEDILLTGAALPDTVGFRILGVANGDNSGHSVSTAGDLNNDGIDDVVVGAYFASKAYVVYGFTPLPTSQPSSQPSRQPSQQPTRQPTRQPSGQPSAQPWSHPTSQPSRQPSDRPSTQPSHQPSRQPSSQPTTQPTRQPNCRPSNQPSAQPSIQPSTQPTSQPSRQPSIQPTVQPSRQPSVLPTGQPSSLPSLQPSVQPSHQPSRQPSSRPSIQPSVQPSQLPSMQPSGQPTSQPSTQPWSAPTSQPSSQPTHQPSVCPSSQPSQQPTGQPTNEPTRIPSVQPSEQPTSVPSSQPSYSPSSQPSEQPTAQPSIQPSSLPSGQPSTQPSCRPSSQPTRQPSEQPTVQPSSQPSCIPTTQPSSTPSDQPSSQPTLLPSMQPTSLPTSQPTLDPSVQPNSIPSLQPISCPTTQPSTAPSMQPSGRPSAQPSSSPTSQPSAQPSSQPSANPTSQPTLSPIVLPPSIISSGEWVENMPVYMTQTKLLYIGNAIWVCGTTAANIDVAVCYMMDKNKDVKQMQLPFISAVTFTAQESRADKLLIGGINSMDAEIAVCAYEVSQLVCNATSYVDTSFVAGTYVPFVDRFTFVGTYNQLASITIVDQIDNTIHSYVYSSIRMKTIRLLKVLSPTNYLGSAVAGVCVNLVSTIYVFAGMVRTDSGLMTAMYLTPASGNIMNSAELVNAMALENEQPDSFIAGGLQLSDDAGMHAYLLRVNTLYYSVLYGMKYTAQTINGSGRRILSESTLINSVARGLVLTDHVLYMIAEYASSHNATGLFVLQLQLSTGYIMKQVHISSDIASLYCTDIVYADLHLVIACTVQFNTTSKQTVLLSVERDLTFSAIPAGFIRDNNITVFAERVTFHRTVLTMAAQSTVSSTKEYTFRTGDSSASHSPTVVPTKVPSIRPSSAPSGQPSSTPTAAPSVSPQPTSQPSSSGPTNTYKPTVKPTQPPSTTPSKEPTPSPSVCPTIAPTARPTVRPSASPSALPSIAASPLPSRDPTCSPTRKPSAHPTAQPSVSPPTESPTVIPSSVARSDSSVIPAHHLAFIIAGAVGGAMVLILLLYQLRQSFNECIWMVVKEEQRMEFAGKYDATAAQPRWWYPYLTSFIACVLCLPNESEDTKNTITGAAPNTTTSQTNMTQPVQSDNIGASAEGPATEPYLDLEANNATNKQSSIPGATATHIPVASENDIRQTETINDESDDSVYLSSESTHSSNYTYNDISVSEGIFNADESGEGDSNSMLSDDKDTNYSE